MVFVYQKEYLFFLREASPSRTQVIRVYQELGYSAGIDMHITQVDVENIPPLGAEVILRCRERANLFVGPNASGKSTILRAIAGDVQYIDDCFFYHKGVEDDSGENGASVFVWVSDDWVQDDPDPDSFINDMVPLLYIPATRVSLPGMDISHVIIDTVWDPEENTPLDNLFDTSSGVFNGYYVELAIRWLGEGNALNRKEQNQLRRVLDIGYSCAKRICVEVMRDGAPHPFIEIDEASVPERVVHHGMGIGTNDCVMGEPLHAGVLSSGTQGTLLWLYALALKIARHYEWQEGWEKQPAILLIDEIENHLHPTWQRRVIPALLEHFPKLQIFATTHSPFVVAGLKAGQVHLLDRDANGVVTATTNEQDIIGWTADEILRTMMGVDEPTDQLTVDRANRLRELREKDALTPEEESELNELRRQVNSDLLSKGGLLEEQRERYANLVREFLRSRQSDLTQDGE